MEKSCTHAEALVQTFPCNSNELCIRAARHVLHVFLHNQILREKQNSTLPLAVEHYNTCLTKKKVPQQNTWFNTQMPGLTQKSTVWHNNALATGSSWHCHYQFVICASVCRAAWLPVTFPMSRLEQWKVSNTSWPRIWCCHYLPPGSLLTLGATESLSYSHVSFNLI